MSDLCSESSEEEQSDAEDSPRERRMTRLPIIQLLPRSRSGSAAGSPKVSPRDSPRGSPRNSPLLLRKLLVNRSINLQRRRFTLAHTPSVVVCCFKPGFGPSTLRRAERRRESRSLSWPTNGDDGDDGDDVGRRGTTWDGPLQGASDGIITLFPAHFSPLRIALLSLPVVHYHRGQLSL